MNKYKLKGKAGYVLKEGKSGEKRWHKKPSNSPLPQSPKYLLKNAEGGKGTPPAPRSSRYQASIDRAALDVQMEKLNKEARAMEESSGFKAKYGDAIEEAKRLIDENWLARSDLGYRPGAYQNNTYASEEVDSTGVETTMGWGHAGYLNIYNRYGDDIIRLQKIKDAPTPVDKMIAMFDDADVDLTPDLPTIADLINQNRGKIAEHLQRDIDMADKDYPITDDPNADYKNRYAKSVTAAPADNMRLLGRLVNDHIVQMEVEADARDRYGRFDEWGGQYNDKVNAHLFNRFGFEATRLDELELPVRLGIAQSADTIWLTATNEDRNNPRNLHGYVASPDGMDYGNIHSAKALDDRMKDFTEKLMEEDEWVERDLKKTLKNLDIRRQRGIESSAIATMFGRLIMDNHFKRIGIESSPRRLEEAPYDDRIESALEDYKHMVTRVKITDESDDYSGLNSMKIYSNTLLSSALTPAHHMPQQGLSITGTLDSISSHSVIPTPGWENAALHEVVHGIDDALLGVSNVIGYKRHPSDLIQSDSIGWGSKSTYILRGTGVLDQLHNEWENGDLNVKDPVAARKIKMARDSLRDQMIKISEVALIEDMTKNADPADRLEYAKRYQKSFLSQNVFSPIFAIPGYERLKYIAGRTGLKYDLLYKLGRESKEPITVTRPPGLKNLYDEIPTVLLEYAMGAPHLLEALDITYGTRLRATVNEYFGASVTRRSNPVLLQDALINIAAMRRGRDGSISHYQGMSHWDRANAPKGGKFLHAPLQYKIDRKRLMKDIIVD